MSAGSLRPIQKNGKSGGNWKATAKVDRIGPRVARLAAVSLGPRSLLQLKLELELELELDGTRRKKRRVRPVRSSQKMHALQQRAQQAGQYGRPNQAIERRA